MMASHRLMLLGIIVMTPLAIGGVRSDVQLVCALLAALTGCLTLYNDRLKGVRAPWVTWVLFLPAIWACIQLMPMPIDLLSRISPTAAALYLTTDPSIAWAPLTVDVTKTTSGAIHHIAFALIFLVAMTSDRQAASQIRWAIIIGACLCCLIATTHWLINAEQIYGLYSSVHREAFTGFFGPFVNENTQASLLVLGCLLACGKTLSARDDRSTWWAMTCALVCGVGVIVSGSRGGIAALLIGWFVLTLFGIKGLDPERPVFTTRVRRTLIIGSVLLLSASVASVLFLDVWGSLSQGSIGDDPKIRAWYEIGGMLPHYGSLGSGRGTFGLVFQQHQSYSVNGTVSHAENYLVQSLIESGVFATVLFLCVIATVWGIAIKATLKRARPSMWASLAGVTAVGAHQTVDFGMESMGLSFAVAAAFGTLFSSRQSASLQRTPRHVMRVASLTLITLVTIAGPSIWTTHGDQHLQALHEADYEALGGLAQSIASAHPADAMVPLTVAGRLYDQVPLPLSELIKWSNRAQALAPREGQSHLILARALARSGRDAQAAGEYRRAIEKTPWAAITVVSEAAQVIKDPRHLASLSRGDSDSERRLVDSLFRLNRPDVIHQLAEEMLLWDAEHHGAPLYLARACLSLKNSECVARQAERLKQTGRTLLALGLSARMAGLKGEWSRAKRLIIDGRQAGGDDDPDFLHHAVHVALSTKDVASGRHAADRLWALSGGRTEHAIRALILRGKVEGILGDPAQGIHAYDQASMLRPSPSITLAAARLEMKFKRLSSARKRLEKASIKWPQNHVIKTLLIRLETVEKKSRREPNLRDD
jgi:hypothetical protein